MSDKIKTVKAPGALRKPIKKNKFKGRYEKYLEHPGDRQFFVSKFDFNDDVYTIRGDLKKEDVKKLKSLLKVIKANRKGAVNFVPLAFASAIIGAIVIFFVVFANPLLGKALEMGLEAIFEAKADVRGFRLSLLKFEISVRHITVANRDSPMTNLFELGRTGIKLRPQAILRGKVYIEWIRAETIRFGTPRTVSGSLGRPPKVKPEKPVNEAPPLINLENFDAMALLEQEFDKLLSPKLYDEAIDTYNEAAERWENQVEESTARVAELRETTAPLLNLNVSGMRDVETIRTTIQQLNTALDSVRGAADDVSKIVSGLDNDINTARRLESNARNALNDDINHLKSYFDLGSGAAFAAIEPFLRDMLSDTAQQYLDYGIIALDALESLKVMAASRPKNEKPPKQPRITFKGRDVHFPTVAYPAFYLGIVASDFTLDSWNWSLDLRNISSNPDFTRHNNFADGPVTLKLGLTEDGGSLHRSIAFNGGADFRSNPAERFRAELTGAGFPVSLGDQLDKLGINGFSGETDFSVNMSQPVNKSIEAGGNVIINNARLIEPQGTLAEAVGIALEEADSVNLGIQYADDSLSITTNIADLIGQALRRTAEVYARRAMAEIETALRQKIDEYIDGRLGSKDQLDSLLRTARGDRAAIDQTRNALNAKIEEFEQRLRSMATDAAQQAGQNLLQNLPSNNPFRR